MLAPSVPFASPGVPRIARAAVRLEPSQCRQLGPCSAVERVLNEVDQELTAREICYFVIGSCARAAFLGKSPVVTPATELVGSNQLPQDTTRTTRPYSDVDVIIPDARELQAVQATLQSIGSRHGVIVDTSLSRVFRKTTQGLGLGFGPLSYAVEPCVMQTRRVRWGQAEFRTLPPQTLLHTYGVVAEPMRAKDRAGAREFARYLKGRREFPSRLLRPFHQFWRAHWKFFPLKPLQYHWRQTITAMPPGTRRLLLCTIYPATPVRLVRRGLNFLETRICTAPRHAAERESPATKPARSKRPASAKGFTLVELLIVLAVIGVLAALILPVVMRGHARARQATCASTLKQFGLAFLMYAQDFDGRLPNPGGRGMQGNSAQAAVPMADNGAVWCSFGTNGKGLFAYLERQSDISNNNWSCPLALPYAPTWEDALYNVGQSYSMNDYLRDGHPGQSVVAEGDVPGSYNPSFHTGIKLDAIGFNADGASGNASGPSQVILLYEAVEHPHGGAKRNGSPYYSAYPSRYSLDDLPRNVPEEYHFGASNFLFCDGHVKALKPVQTWTSATQNKLERLSFHYAHARGGRRGVGTFDAWNPSVANVVYP